MNSKARNRIYRRKNETNRDRVREIEYTNNNTHKIAKLAHSPE